MEKLTECEKVLIKHKAKSKITITGYHFIHFNLIPIILFLSFFKYNLVTFNKIMNVTTIHILNI